MPNKNTKDSEAYLSKKAFFDKVLTLYGRHAVMEALLDESLTIHKLHLSTSNKPSDEINQMVQIADRRGIPVVWHPKQALSRISRNTRQDQGVALDVVMDHFVDEGTMLEQESYRIIALDGVTNPQNLGMIIRSCAAGKVDALLLPTKGNAQITPLVIQASAGTLFRLPIIKTSDLVASLERFRKHNANVYALEADAPLDYRHVPAHEKSIFVLGNESEGISPAVSKVCNVAIAIPMARGVESLNVAVTASLLAFC